MLHRIGRQNPLLDPCDQYFTALQTIVKVNHNFYLEQCPVAVLIVHITNKTNIEMQKTPVIYPGHPEAKRMFERTMNQPFIQLQPGSMSKKISTKASQEDMIWLVRGPARTTTSISCANGDTSLATSGTEKNRIHQTKAHVITSSTRGEGLRESISRPGGERLRGVGERSLRTRLSGLPFVGDKLLRGDSFL
ncbi:hypothetical protein H5410_010671 [Solanum commersonii]|uniref:Uncharacterized protein n=1 Tax=Solanum commersonii TaxID=4109 RepID=A0A9J6ALD3_SOLCO|nr:hypothetical protein H5410_010671 [Solanum commersonii]